MALEEHQKQNKMTLEQHQKTNILAVEKQFFKKNNQHTGSRAT